MSYKSVKYAIRKCSISTPANPPLTSFITIRHLVPYDDLQPPLDSELQITMNRSIDKLQHWFTVSRSIIGYYLKRCKCLQDRPIPKLKQWNNQYRLVESWNQSNSVMLSRRRHSMTYGTVLENAPVDFNSCQTVYWIFHEILY